MKGTFQLDYFQKKLEVFFIAISATHQTDFGIDSTTKQLFL